MIARPGSWPRALLRRPDAVTLAVLAVTLVALVMRLYDLGARAMHHDESLHAAFAFYFAEGGGYRQDPLMHGPLQFHVIAALFKLLGDGETAARLFAALAGTALVGAPLLLRRWLGSAGVVIAAVLLALSPSLLYYSRFVRNDLPIALFTLLLVAAVWRYREEGRARWLALAAAALSLSFATKETAYLTLAMLLVYVDVSLALAMLRRRTSRGWRRALEAAALLAGAWVAAAAWRPLGERLAPGPRPREADLLVVLGTLAAPLLAAAVQLPLQAMGARWEGDRELVGGTAAVVALLAGGAAVGLAWDWRRWTPLALLFYAPLLLLYSTGFTNLDGVGSGLWGSLDYWLAQQDVQRGTQPWFYYLMMLPLYEFLALLPALAGGAWLLWRGDRLARLLAWWLLGTLLALSVAGEKMPWLTVHLALPAALLAARALGVALPRLAAALRRPGAPPFAWGGAGATLAAAALLLALSTRTALGVAFAHPDTPVEPLIYTQTTPDVPALAREIEALAEAWPGRDRLTVMVDTTSSFTWPWAWYLRRMPLRYASAAALASSVPEAAVVIATDATLRANPGLRDGFAEARPYRHRWWFPERGYRAATARGLLEALIDGSLLADWAGFVAGGVEERTLGSIGGEVLFPPPPPAAR